MKEKKEKCIEKRGMVWSMAGLIVVLLLVWFSYMRRDVQWDDGLVSPEWNYITVGNVSVVGYPIKAIIYADATRLWEIKHMVNLNEVDLKIDYHLLGAVVHVQRGFLKGREFLAQFADESNVKVIRKGRRQTTD